MLKESDYYSAVVEEINRDGRDEKLWTIARVKAEGDAERAESLYIKLRARELRSERMKQSAQRASRKTGRATFRLMEVALAVALLTIAVGFMVMMPMLFRDADLPAMTIGLPTYLILILTLCFYGVRLLRGRG